MELVPHQSDVPALTTNATYFKTLEEFTKLINREPNKDGIVRTPDGKADTLAISYVEAGLDEVFLRQWGDENLQITQIGNEILVSLTLWVIDPLTKERLTRSGGSEIQIMVDRAPDGLTAKEKNTWALDMSNKKPNALKLHFPAAISLARKNAAKTLCTYLGRNLNRKVEDTPDAFYTNEFEAREKMDAIGQQLEQAKTSAELLDIWNEYPDMQENQEFKKAFSYFKNELKKK